MRKRISLLIAISVSLFALYVPAIAGTGNVWLEDNLALFPDLVKDGVTQPIFNATGNGVITEAVWVEAPADTDRDGKRDLLYVQIKRPVETNKTNGLKVPVIASVSPYANGTAPGGEVDKYNARVDKDYDGALNSETMDATYEDVKYTGPTYKDLVEANFNPSWLPPARTPQGQQDDGKPIDNWNVTAWQSYFIPRGYACVSVNMFGTVYSEGITLSGSYEEALGAAAVVDWLNGRIKAYADPDGTTEVKAYWATGDVAMGGQSYVGFLPVAAAVTGVEGLKTIIPIAPPTSWYEYYRSNGLVYAPGGYQGEDCSALIAYCSARIYNTPSVTALQPPKPSNLMGVYYSIMYEVGFDQDRYTGDYNSFWGARNYLQFMDNVKCSIVMMHGLNDTNVKLKHTAMLYDACKKYGIPNKLIYHLSGHSTVNTNEALNFTYNMQKWMDYHLYGIQNGIMEEMPNVVIANNNTLEWDEYDTWPAGKYKKLYFSGVRDIGELSESPQEKPATLSFVDDYLIGMSRPNNVNSTPTMTNTQHTQWRNHLIAGNDTLAADFDPLGFIPPVVDRLLYYTDIAEDTRISGTVKVTAKVAANKNTGAISAMLVDYGYDYYATGSTESTGNVISPGGGLANIILRRWVKPATMSPYKIIARGSVDVQNPNSNKHIWTDAADTNYVPEFLYQTAKIEVGNYYSYTWELDVTDYNILAGHRLGLILYGSDPEYTTRPFNPTTFSVEIGPNSYLSLPVAGYVPSEEAELQGLINELQELINEAAALLDDAIANEKIGNDAGQYPSAEADALNAAIDEANAVLTELDINDETAIEDAQAGIAALQDAVSQFNDSIIGDTKNSGGNSGCNTGISWLLAIALMPLVLKRRGKA